MSSFGPRFIGLTGESVAIREMAKTFKVFFQKIPQPSGDYTMDHSAVIYVLDAQARVRLMFTATRQLEDVAHDILELLHETS
jgi:protein SCO1/2